MAFPKPGLSGAERRVLSDAGTLLIDPQGPPWSLSLAPDAGATVTVKVTCSPEALIDPDDPEAEGGAVWHTLGAYTAPELIAFPSPITAVLVISTSGGVTLDVCG